MRQVFVDYFLNFQKKPKMTGRQKLHIIYLPIFIFHVLPGGFELSSSAHKDCRPTTLATDSLGILIPSLFCFPADGPAVHVPPPATVFAVLCFVAISAWKVGCFSSHPVRYRPSIADWNKRQPSQYGGHWNHIQDLRQFTALICQIFA